MVNCVTAKSKVGVSTSGFSIIELLVTLSIIVLATGMVMIKYASFNSSLLLTNQAYAVAFDIRETQSLAVSVRGSSNEFRQEYGMYFDMTTPGQYLLFQDSDSDSPVRYDVGEEFGDSHLVDPRFTLIDLCGTNLGGVRSCYSTEGFPENISIAFSRPDFDAIIMGEGIVGQLVEAEILITGSKDSVITKTVEVSTSGQITVK